MPILSRPKLISQERFDLEDYNALLSALRSDSKFWTKQFLSGENYIIKGFAVSGIGLNSATVEMDNATLIMSSNTSDFSWFTAEDSPADIVITDGDLVDGVRNYVELKLGTENNTPIVKAFWDPSANGGEGSEFNQQIDTMVDLAADVEVSQGGFSGSPDRIPLAIIDTDGAGIIKIILDKRPLFFRLGSNTDPDAEFSWVSQLEPVYNLTLSSVTGTFTAGETITIGGGVTATVVTGGTTSISMRLPSGINFSSGDSVSGGGSGATGTLETALESFTGADKDVDDFRESLSAIMTEIKRIKGTRWYEASTSSLVGLSEFFNSQLVQATAGAKFAWDGANLTINDSALSPGNTDVVGYLRQMGKGTDMSLTRQSAGLEVQKIVFSSNPDTGVITLDQNGDISDNILPGDDATAVQTACNNQWTNQVTVTGDFANGFTFTFNTAGDQVEISENSNTLQTGATPVTTVITTVQNGYAGGSVIPVGLDQVMFIKVPDTGNRTFDGVGVGDSNYQVVDRDAFVAGDGNYWVAFNEGGVLYVRGAGELQAGEESAISDPDKETILALINANGVRDNQDRNIKVVEGGTWNLVGNDLTLSADAYTEVGGLERIRNTIVAQTITLPNATSVAYVEVNRDGTGASNRVVAVVDVEDLILTENTVIVARKVSGGVVVGTSSFLLKDGEFLELDAALAEINRYFGQLQIKAHLTDADRVTISGSDISKLNGTSIGQSLRNLLLKFDGAEIDFETGEIFEDDGATPLGIDFTPATIAASQWFWYSVTLIPSAALADNTISAQLLVLPATASGASKAAAPKAPFANGIQLGQIAVQQNAGDTELEDIVQADIVQLGVGGGGAGGTGDANSDLTRYQDRINLAPFELAATNIASIDEDTLLDGASTASFDIPTQTFKFSAIGQTVVTTALLDSEFLTEGLDLNRVEFYGIYELDNIDANPTVELSKNGGNDWEAVTISRIGLSDAFRGILTFAAPSNSFIQEKSTDNDVSDLDDAGAQALSNKFTILNTAIFQDTLIYLNKATANAAGKYYIEVIKDDTGNVSTDPNDVVFSSKFFNVSDLAVGDNSTDVSGSYVLVPGDYHLVIRTDQAYKDGYTSNNADKISVRVDNAGAAPKLRAFNGTVWGAEDASDVMRYRLEGYELDLRVRVTSSASDTLLRSLAVFYKSEDGIDFSGKVFRQLFSFDGTVDNDNEFTIDEFLPDSRLLMVFERGTGKVFRYGDFVLDGHKVVFPANTFNVVGTVELEMFQVEAGGLDASNENAALMTANHLGSTDPSIDKSANGRGIIVRRPDGTLREIALDDNDDVVIRSVP